jgi:hypothetical protein
LRQLGAKQLLAIAYLHGKRVRFAKEFLLSQHPRVLQR